MFPFNINKPMPNDALKIMEKGCGILNKLNVKYSLADGTLLGVYRDNKLIKHDTDIDVAVVHPINARRIENEFKRNGFKIGRKVVSLNTVQQIVFYSQNEVPFDIIFYSKFKNNVYAFCEKDFYFKHKSDHYNTLQPYVFNEFTYFIPQDTEIWLNHTYGSNWRTPTSSKPNDWREGGCEYLTAVSFNGDFINLLKEIEQNEMA